jgi:hypothetical protein
MRPGWQKREIYGYLMGLTAYWPSFRDGPKDQTRNLEIPGSPSKSAVADLDNDFAELG